MDKDVLPLQKFHEIDVYQLEFGDEISICPGLNVSRSLGFKSVLGIFGEFDAVHRSRGEW